MSKKNLKFLGDIHIDVIKRDIGIEIKDEPNSADIFSKLKV